jgi:molecular chaperone GrpE
MATKRRSEHDSQRQPPPPSSPAAEPVEPEKPASEPPEAEARETETSPGAPEAGTDEASTGKDEAPPADEAAAGQVGGRVEELTSQLEELASQLEEANNRYVRLAADFDNFKKRARQEQLDTMRHAAATVVERLLPVLDDADRALSHAPEGVDESWLKGVQLTFQQLEDVLASVGVERITAVGSPFDPKLHEAIGSEETSEQPEDTVVVELRPGYRMHDRVLRPSLVKVARRPA